MTNGKRRQRRVFTAAFKLEAIRHLRARKAVGVPVTQIARELDPRRGCGQTMGSGSQGGGRRESHDGLSGAWARAQRPGGAARPPAGG
jgi:hypothetical protein